MQGNKLKKRDKMTMVSQRYKLIPPRKTEDQRI